MADLLLDDYIDFQLLGITSNLSNSFQFAYYLNASYQTKFKRDFDLDVIVNNRTIYYSNFIWEDINNHLVFNLIKNAPFQTHISDHDSIHGLFDVSPLLIPQQKNYNYILKVSGCDYGAQQVNLPFSLDVNIQSIAAFDVNQIKTIDRLIF